MTIGDTMTTATLNRPTEPTAASIDATTTDVNQPGLGTRPDEVVRLGEINGLAEVTQSIRQASTIAGVGLLLMSVLSAFGYLVAVKGLVVPGNAARTANNITGHEGLFRFGILSLYLVAALDVVVAWAPTSPTGTSPMTSCGEAPSVSPCKATSSSTPSMSA